MDVGGAGRRADPKPKVSVLGMAVMVCVSVGQAWWLEAVVGVLGSEEFGD